MSKKKKSKDDLVVENCNLMSTLDMAQQILWAYAVFNRAATECVDLMQVAYKQADDGDEVDVELVMDQAYQVAFNEIYIEGCSDAEDKH